MLNIKQKVELEVSLSKIVSNKDVYNRGMVNARYLIAILSYFLDSPADLHGMWYPTVRRTLVCLSRLYRSIDRPIFQSLSQEALSFCIQSVSNAAQLIATKKVNFHVYLIKELIKKQRFLILESNRW